MNRHAISPLPPLASKSTDGGGVVYSTTWDIDVPYRGFFGLRSTVDNGGRILIDGVEVARGGLDFRPNDGITGFRNEPGIKRFSSKKVSMRLPSNFLMRIQRVVKSLNKKFSALLTGQYRRQ